MSPQRSNARSTSANCPVRSVDFVWKAAASFSAGAPCDPADAQRVAAEVHAVFTDFAAHGPTDEELSNAIKQVTTGLDAQMKEPGYWLRALQHLELHGRDLAEQKTEMEAYEHYTAEQVREVFERFYTPQRRFTVTSVPTDAGGGDE